MNFPNREVVQHIRETYPVGCRVELIGRGRTRTVNWSVEAKGQSTMWTIPAPPL